MSGRLAGKRCLIVGGTSGLGLAAAKRFMEEGAKLVVVGVESANEIASRLPLGGIYVACDATQPDQVALLYQQTLARLGGLDVLYHVAGGSGRRFGDGSLHECTDAGWQATLDMNLKSTFLTNRAALQYFLAHHQAGVILNMASVLALAPAPEFFDTAAYTAAKGGLIAMSRLAAARYAGDDIRINVLAPGLVDTPMAARACADSVIRDFLKTKQALADGPACAEDCSGAAVFLCSDEARLITGVVLPVDGGWTTCEGRDRSG